jgi:hypothetical protein
MKFQIVRNPLDLGSVLREVAIEASHADDVGSSSDGRVNAGGLDLHDSARHSAEKADSGSKTGTSKDLSGSTGGGGSSGGLGDSGIRAPGGGGYVHPL